MRLQQTSHSIPPELKALLFSTALAREACNAFVRDVIARQIWIFPDGVQCQLLLGALVRLGRRSRRRIEEEEEEEEDGRRGRRGRSVEEIERYKRERERKKEREDELVKERPNRRP